MTEILGDFDTELRDKPLNSQPIRAQAVVGGRRWSFVALTQDDPQSPALGVMRGRRKQIPLLLVGAGFGIVVLLTTSHALTRVVEGVFLVLISGWVYRYWVAPTTPRYERAMRRRRELRGLPVSPKVILGVIVTIVAFYATFFLLVTKY